MLQQAQRIGAARGNVRCLHEELVEPRLEVDRQVERGIGAALVRAGIVPAVLFYSRPDILVPALSACVLAYHLLYRRVAVSAGDSELPEAEAADLRA